MDEMRPMRLDATTADRLADGLIGPDDAPPGYAGVAELLSQARPGIAGSAREAATVAAMSAVLGHLDPLTTTVRGKKMLSKVLTVKAGVVAGVVLFGAGSAAAATGTLPTQAQSAVHNALAHLDISIPKGHSDSNGPSSNPSKALTNPHALPGLCNAASHNGTLSTTSSVPKPNKHSVFGSITSSTCQGVSSPGQSGTDDSNDDSTGSNGTDHSTGKPSSSPNGPPSGTPASSNAPVPSPDEGTAGSSASGGAGSAGLGTAAGNDDGASSTGTSAANAGSGNATSQP
jgi:hypothetical protein